MRSQKLKMISRALLVSLFTLMVLPLASCLHVVVKDSEWCGDAGQQGATCFHTLTGAQRDLAKEQWDAERFGMVCTKATTFADWKGYLEKLCAKNHCDFEKLSQIFDQPETCWATYLGDCTTSGYCPPEAIPCAQAPMCVRPYDPGCKQYGHCKQVELDCKTGQVIRVDP